MASKSLENLLNEISALTVLELNELIESIETKFGVSAAMSMSAGSAPVEEASAKAEEKSEYKVELLEAGDKMKTIKALRQVKKDLGLIEAKKMAEETPSVVAEGVSADEAKTIKEVLEAAGAKVKLS